MPPILHIVACIIPSTYIKFISNANWKIQKQQKMWNPNTEHSNHSYCVGMSVTVKCDERWVCLCVHTCVLMCLFLVWYIHLFICECMCVRVCVCMFDCLSVCKCAKRKTDRGPTMLCRKAYHNMFCFFAHDSIRKPKKVKQPYINITLIGFNLSQYIFDVREEKPK